MSYDLEEQEQLENLKIWWNKYGKLITNTITAGLIGVSIFFAYKWWQSDREHKAYNLVSQLNMAIENKKNTEILQVARTLNEKYPNSTHNAISILRATEALPSENRNDSIDLLKNIINNSKQKEYAVLASYRLASLLIDSKKFDEAIELMNKPSNNIWQGLFADRAGDAYVAKGDKIKAREMYDKALKIFKEGQNKALQNFIELKINIIAPTIN